ncbi:MAG: hypothetical protein WCT05_14350, partial [Lentisphaeria bacterium]
MLNEFFLAPPESSERQEQNSKTFHSLSEAFAALRVLKKRGELDYPVTVWCKEGIYPLSAPLILTPEDSLPVTFKAVPGEKPIFDG